MCFWMTLIFLASTRAGGSGQTYYLAKKALSVFDPAEAVSASPEALAKVNFLIRKLAHVSEYFLLTILTIRALSALMRRGLGVVFASAAAALLYAASDEFHQRFVPGRTSSPHDVLIDSYGIALASLLTLWLTLLRALERQIKKTANSSSTRKQAAR